MRRFQILACAIVLSVVSLLGAPAVLASGTSTSAGDQQYVDPLTNNNTTSHPSSSPSSSPSTTQSQNNTSLSNAPPSSLSSGSSSSSSSASAHSGNLPFTGMNVGACVAIGAGLLGAGVVLRRRVLSA